MGYIEEIFYIFTAFMIAYFIFRHYDVLKKIAYPSVIDKDFSSCYILKYPQYAEFHNKNNFYTIDIDEFFELNPKLKDKIKIIDRPEFDSKDIDAVRAEILERRKIKEEFDCKKSNL